VARFRGPPPRHNRIRGQTPSSFLRKQQERGDFCKYAEHLSRIGDIKRFLGFWERGQLRQAQARERSAPETQVSQEYLLYCSTARPFFPASTPSHLAVLIQRFLSQSQKLAW
jgi:hypothetical protein